jgi:hypothetical protein
MSYWVLAIISIVLVLLSIVSLSFTPRWRHYFGNREGFIANTQLLQQANTYWISNVPTGFQDSLTKVMVFTEKNFSGSSQRFIASQSDKDLLLATFDKKMQSLILGPRCTITLFGTGKQVAEYNNPHDTILPVPDLKELNKKVTSFKLSLIEPYVILYPHENNGGNGTLLNENFAVMPPNKTISSIAISPYTEVAMYSQKDFRGESLKYSNTTPQVYTVDYIGNEWAQGKKRVQSVQIKQLLDKKRR